MLLDINRIEFMTTYHCSGKCKHCSVSGILNTGDHKHIDEGIALKAIEGLTQRFGIKSLMTFGGEPLLYPDVVCAIHSEAAECGIPTRHLITNGYFGKSTERIAGTAKALVSNKVDHVLLSVDAFHQETIPIGTVKEFAQALMDAGIPDLKLQPAWVVNEGNDNSYNTITRGILKGFSDLGIEIARGNDIFLAGNAKEYLSGYYPEPELDLSLGCGNMPYTAPLTDITSLSIVPNGDVKICHFTIGNLHDGDIDGIMDNYDPYANPYMNAIIEHGVQGLADMAEDRGLDTDVTGSRSICEACQVLYGRLRVGYADPSG